MSETTQGPDLESWYESVAAVLAKTSRKDPADMPDDAWRSLVATTLDGLEINPLYTRVDELPEQPEPGQFPFVRGGSRAGLPESGWHVVARFDASDRAADANTQVLAQLGEGVSALWLRANAADVAPALKGVYLDLAPVHLDAGADTTEVAKAYLDLLDERKAAGDGAERRASIVATLGVSPLEAGFRGSESISDDAALQLAARAADRDESIRTFVADGTAFNDAGAGDAHELAYAIAAGVDYVRRMVEAGLTPADALGQVAFRLAATDDQFATIAKFRAGRLMWARVAEALGEPDAGDAPQHAVTAAPIMAQRDPWVNMLRTTLAAFGAGVGGATGVTVLPFDSSLPGGLEGTSTAFAERIARNTQLLLLEESHLGHVVDPAGGSWYVESFTESLAAKAWEIFQQVERSGGLSAAIESGDVARAIEEIRSERDAQVARRELPLTGVSEFPNIAEPDLDSSRRGAEGYRYGRAFEALRDRSDAHREATGERPTILLAGLGTLAEISARQTFVTNLLAAGGIAVRVPGTVTPDDIAGAVDSDTVAVLCGTDKRYASEGPAAVSALRSAGVQRVYLAGAKKGFPDDAGDSERPDDHLALGIDAISALTAVLDDLGVN